MKNIVFFIITLLILLLVAWRIVPLEPLISKSADNALKKYGCSLGLEGLEKGLFLDFSVKRLFIRSADKEIISFESLKASFNPLALSLQFKGSALDGRIEGKYKIRDGLHAKLSGLSLQQLNPWFGIRAKGIVNADIEKNRIYFLSEGISLADIIFEEAILPLSMFSKVRGTIFINGGHVLIESAELEGQIGNAIIRGKLYPKFLDAVVDFMPLQDQLWSGLLSDYRVKEKLYRIPLKRNLSLMN